ncbi:complex I subunit 4 family protein [Anaerosinus massiliensis]|uniref:complex I subunit 4 family protein n=1 Tax=Massilibacillus massiliensis TaxID=1806837 RepID=UPI000A9E6444|nr:NADH-quinone oxidoreductase subunit M [Massilibacillus massiliensis]
MSEFPLLTTILLTPVLGILILSCMPRAADQMIKMISAITMLITLALTMYAYGAYDVSLGGMQYKENVVWVPDLGVSYALGVDGISLPLLLLTVLVGFSAVFVSWKVEKRSKEFFIQLLLLVVGAIGTFVAQDLFIFLLFYEVGIIPSYIMMVVWGSAKRVRKEYAAMKLVIYLLLGSAFMLAGVIALYINAFPAGMRTFSLQVLAQAQAFGHLSESVQIIAFFLLLLGFGSTLAMWPFYSWAPDGYAAAPTGVAMLHAGVLKKIGAYGLIRIGMVILPLGAKFWAPMIAFVAVINILYGAFLALVQKDLKYMVSYSSISHIGYILVGFAALNIISMNGAIANMFAHGIMSALFFAMIGLVHEKTSTRQISELGGLAHQMPRVAIGFMLAGMSALGLPGLVGFIPEFISFVGAFKVYPWHTLLAVSGIIFTALYVLRMLANILFGPRRREFDACRDASGVELVPLTVLGAVLVVAGVFPQLLMGMVNSGVEPMMSVFVNLPITPTLLGGVFK